MGMSAHLHARLRLLLWLLVVVFGVDQGVALAQEFHFEGKGGHAWVRHSGTRGPVCRLAFDLPDGPAALPAPPVELPVLDAWTRVSLPAERSATAPRAAALRSGYPRGPPA